MRGHIAILLAAAILLALGSCGENAGTTGVPEATEETEMAETKKERVFLTVAGAGTSAFQIIRADGANSAVIKMTTEFRKEFSKKTGVEMPYVTDFVSPVTPLDPGAPELLVGETNREESVRLMEKLRASGQNRYGILVSEHKVAVAGTNEYMTYLALRYFMDENVRMGDDCLPEVVMEAGTEYISEEQTAGIPDFKEAKNQNLKLAFYAVEQQLRLKPTKGFGTLQGGGTDGTYAYYAMINSGTLEGVIKKYDLETWKLVATSEPMKIAHANDIAFDSVNNRLVLSYCHETDGYLGLTTVNPDTLEFISYFTIDITNRAVEYLPATNQYLLAKGYHYTLTDDRFKAIRSFDSAWPQKTTQGMCYDGKYIYDVRWEAGDVQYIDVHDLNGKWYGNIPYYGADGEPENIFRHGDDFYVALNGSLKVWKLKLLPDKWW